MKRPWVIDWNIAGEAKVRTFATAAKARAFFAKITADPATITAWMSNPKDKVVRSYDRDADDPSLD